jgi:23S rRNA (pseudouridine1915-N3)-methyltransferase
MKIVFFWLGKTAGGWLQDGIDEYLGRLKHYVPVSIEIISLPKNLSGQGPDRLKNLEGDAILNRLSPSDEVFLLDGRGLAYSSEELAGFLQKKTLSGTKRMVFVIGGAFGFSEKVYRRADGLLSFSKFTFSHQMIRLLLCEQFYRAFTIIRGESYHHGG